MSDRLGHLIVDPDAFLETDAGRVWTPERNRDAWQCAFAALEHMLEQPGIHRLVVVCGLQGAGKSTWIRRQPLQFDTAYFDAALPAARHRRPIIDIARSASTAPEAVWIRAPLTMAIERNARREPDKRVPETSISSVHRLFEPPTHAEGFERIRIVNAAEAQARSASPFD